MGTLMMIIDLHCHSKYSHDNHQEPEELIERAIVLGLDGICFTEHHSFDCSWPIARLKTPRDFLVLRAVEVSTDLGHLLVYGVEDDSWNRWGRNYHLKMIEVVESVHERNGICVPAHPFRGWESLGDKIYRLSGFDGVETHNGCNTPKQNSPALLASHTLGLPSIGGSDCHVIERLGQAYTEFSNPIRSMADLVKEIKAGNCRGVYVE
jgi:predicted metal-dependent phosphoesterase TrpH